MQNHRLLLVVTLCLLICRTASAQTVVDPDLRVQTYVKNLSAPTGIVFLNGSGDALVTQKNDGKVIFIHNRQIAGTALDLPVANNSERGLLSIALSPNFANDQRVFLYHTVAAQDGGDSTSNRISRWRWDGSKLVFERTIMDLAGGPGPNHDGGKLTFDTKGKLLAVIGDLNVNQRTQNFENSSTTTRTGALLRIERNGNRILTNPFAGPAGSARTAADDILAYGIRNSFGIAIDPVTGSIWDTENGPDRFDEINRVSAGFNSGWQDIMGPQSRNGGTTGTLVSLGSRAAYSDPEFSWADTVAPTDLHFFNSARLGSQYQNDLFVGDVNTGTIFHFDLTSDRKSLVLGGDLADLVADNTGGLLDEQESIIFGSGFGVVTDLLNGPGGMFALSLSNGRLYRITTNSASSAPAAEALSLRTTNVPEPSAMLGVGLLIALRRRGTRAGRSETACRSVSISRGCRGWRRSRDRSCCGSAGRSPA
jgi:aldose sugar dehydrogenase